MAELQPWGGEFTLPRLLRWPLRRLNPDHTPERVHERRKPHYSDVAVLENADQAIFGAWSEGHPGNRRPKH
jgi:hypothetical protein